MKLHPWRTLLLLALPLLAGCRMRPPAPRTVPGAEHAEIGHDLPGALLAEGEDGTVRALDLHDGQSSVVRVRTDTNEPVIKLAGLGAGGVAAAVLEKRDRHSLVTLDIATGHETVLFERPGSAIWDHVIGSLSMTPSGNELALVSHLQQRQMSDPPALLEAGSLEIWDLRTGKFKVIANDVLEDSVHWFPDGRRVAISRLVAGPPAAELVTDGFGESWAHWDATPVVSVLDTVTGAERPLHVGWLPVVATDGKQVLVSDFDFHWCLVDAGGGPTKAVSLPGSWGAATALLADGRVIYRALPTAGAKVGYTLYNSPLSGPKQLMAVKAGQLATGQFCTLLSDVDPRSCLSYGPGVVGKPAPASRR